MIFFSFLTQRHDSKNCKNKIISWHTYKSFVKRLKAFTIEQQFNIHNDRLLSPTSVIGWKAVPLDEKALLHFVETFKISQKYNKIICFNKLKPWFRIYFNKKKNYFQQDSPLTHFVHKILICCKPLLICSQNIYVGA